MAVMVEVKCPTCKKVYRTGVPARMGYISELLCSDCEKLEKEVKEKAHFDVLDSMTIDERVRRIEKILYDMSVNPKPERFDPYALIG